MDGETPWREKSTASKAIDVLSWTLVIAVFLLGVIFYTR